MLTEVGALNQLHRGHTDRRSSKDIPDLLLYHTAEASLREEEQREEKSLL